ncbi:hypothetical protein GCM10023169_15640 [Georgenia halophila]|uniref:DUF4229 domain-containing protein n=1 Tax=Georgenia halophila TaxID=620889 RepID=A0ABP8L3D5_9MICO
MILAVLLAESPSPSPEPSELQAWEASPGLMGFVFGFFLLALAVIPLFRSMVKHMRRVEHNAEVRRLEEEAAAEEQEQADGGETSDGGWDGEKPDDGEPSPGGAGHREQTGSSPGA